MEQFCSPTGGAKNENNGRTLAKIPSNVYDKFQGIIYHEFDGYLFLFLSFSEDILVLAEAAVFRTDLAAFACHASVMKSGGGVPANHTRFDSIAQVHIAGYIGLHCKTTATWHSAK